MNGHYAKKTNKKLTHLTHFGCSFVFIFLIRNVIMSFFLYFILYEYIYTIIGSQLAFEKSNSLAQNSFNDWTIDSRKVDLSSFVIQVLNIYEYMSPSSSITFGQFIYFISTDRQTDGRGRVCQVIAKGPRDIKYMFGIQMGYGYGMVWIIIS